MIKTLLMAMLVTTPALAENAYQACTAEAANTLEMAECGKTEVARQERLLTAAWADASAFLKKQDSFAFQALLSEQRAWIKWKDTSCQVYLGDSFGREGPTVQYPTCLASVIGSRVRYLTAIGQ